MTSENEMSPARENQLLEAEYFKLQDIVESFDERALQIKGWSVTVSLAALVAAYAEKLTKVEDRDIILVIAIVSAIAFWAIEYLWKSFQWAFVARIEEIEAHFADPVANPTRPLRIRSVWQANFKPKLWHNFSRGKPLSVAIMLPHIGIAALALALLLAGR